MISTHEGKELTLERVTPLDAELTETRSEAKERESEYVGQYTHL